jgi:hypothetical protein
MRTVPIVALFFFVACSDSAPPTSAPTAPAAPASPQTEEAAARVVFEANIKAIQDKNKEAYLACYRQDERLVRAGGDGVKLGFAAFGKDAPATGSDDWPERLEAEDVQVHWLAPGVVYGAYRYRVTIKGVTTTGLSERVLLKGDNGWKVSVTTAFETPADKPKDKPENKPGDKPAADAGAKD